MFNKISAAKTSDVGVHNCSGLQAVRVVEYVHFYYAGFTREVSNRTSSICVRRLLETKICIMRDPPGIRTKTKGIHRNPIELVEFL